MNTCGILGMVQSPLLKSELPTWEPRDLDFMLLRVISSEQEVNGGDPALPCAVKGVNGTDLGVLHLADNLLVLLLRSQSMVACSRDPPAPAGTVPLFPPFCPPQNVPVPSFLAATAWEDFSVQGHSSLNGPASSTPVERDLTVVLGSFLRQTAP